MRKNKRHAGNHIVFKTIDRKDIPVLSVRRIYLSEEDLENKLNKNKKFFQE
ncbi:hypothetical protein HPT25_17495 [Bacillus sp. BRMEA1]|uniref:hypothetical protein n=1 Tax=Neobacillus endophyticus TaxID=2738405 RepID=UPI001565ABC3|nr:hypothetical protein [Neobacillus endophyticus]NRD79155.1 hypothetical protein [Neobacillus endophyticus]